MSRIQESILSENFSQAKFELEAVQEFLSEEWMSCESREEEQQVVEYRIFTARQLAGVYHELGMENEAMLQCDVVLAMEKECKRLGMLDSVFCDLNFACAVKAEIYALQGNMESALKYQNFLIDGRLKKKLSKPMFDNNLRSLLKRTLSLELAMRGRMFVAMGRLEEALKDFTESLQCSYTDPQTLLLKARVYLMKSEYKLALKDARECLSLSSNSFTRKQATQLIDQCLSAQSSQHW